MDTKDVVGAVVGLAILDRVINSNPPPRRKKKTIQNDYFRW